MNYFHLITNSQTGFINALAFSDDGRVLVVGVGVQHKRGRWFESATGMKNAIVTIPLSYS
jgi:ribosomal RNA-processing protein 9